MTVKARMYVESVTQGGYPDAGGNPISTGETVSFRAVYESDPSGPNYSYSKATPNATLEMTISNEAAIGYFKPGVTYDLTFTPTAK